MAIQGILQILKKELQSTYGGILSIIASKTSVMPVPSLAEI